MAVCSTCIVITDAARRMSDNINARVVFTTWDQLCNAWMAFKLSDGSSDGVLYDTRDDAVNHQLHERMCAYFYMRNALGGTNPRDCQLFLDMHRNVYDNGGHFTDPLAPSAILPLH